MPPRTYSSQRRSAGAAQTRADILRSALELFTDPGYQAVVMPQVAERAAVSVATIYATVGGKPQLLLALLDAASTDVTIAEAMDSVMAAATPLEVVQALGRGTRSVSERHQWLLSTLFDVAATEPAVADRVAAANADLQHKLEQSAERVQALGGAADRPRALVATVLLFHFGPPAWRVLVDAGWTWDEAEAWLVEQVRRALLT